MTHQEAIQIEAVDKYLLNEMTPQARDEFEEHYFDCQECSTDLRATAAFMDEAKKELKGHIGQRPTLHPVSVVHAIGQPVVQSPFSLRWKPFALPFALAASLLVIAYQNVLVYPGYKAEIAQLEAPQVLPTISLIGANSRGGEITSAAIGSSKRIQIVFEIPTKDQFKSYEGLLYAPSGELLGKVQISSQAAKDTVTMDAPMGNRQVGSYHLVVKGKTSASDEAGTIVQDYPFALSAQ